MTQDAPIIVTSGHEAVIHHRDNNFKTLTFELDILGEAATFYINVSRKTARLSDLAVPARTLATKISHLMQNKLCKSGEYIPCRKGCSACCSYIVPLSIPEVFRLGEEVSAMPSERRNAILRTVLKAAGRILDHTPNYSENGAILMGSGQEEMDRLSLWYTGLELACPFLRNNLCSYYEQRPIACREHMVTSLESCCGDNGDDEPSAVRISASVLECLGKLTADLEQCDMEAVMLPLALPWAQDNLDRSRRTWPAVTMVERFIGILTAASEQTDSARTLCALRGQRGQLSLV